MEKAESVVIPAAWEIRQKEKQKDAPGEDVSQETFSEQNKEDEGEQVEIVC